MTGDSVLQQAGTTAVLGMAVVFLSLFLLSVYMHYFKIWIARFQEGRRKARERNSGADSPASLVTEPAPVSTTESGPRQDEVRVAAAVAVGLHLRGLKAAPGDAVAAAIATALALHRRPAVPASSAAGAPASGWKLAGRFEAMASHSGHRARPSAR